MPAQREATDLVDVGADIHGRLVRLVPETARAWTRMKESADRDGIRLLLISGFRSIGRQQEIFLQKLAAGLKFEDILKTNAYPGHSEHHTGRAIDVGSPDAEPLTESFEGTAEFRWLADNAGEYGFRLSYPRKNRTGIAYEPWHWAQKTQRAGRSPAANESSAMTSLRFRAVIEMQNINPFVQVSARRAARLRRGWRRPLPVCVRVNGRPKKPWRINLMPVGDGSFRLYLHGDVRKASGTKVGDTVTVTLAFDPAYRGGPAHPMPRWFRDALRRNGKARRAWTALSPSRRKEILRYFSHLKTPEARVRNLQRAIRVLSGSRARFMARSWNE